VIPSPETPAALLAARLARDPARPFVTFYDEATGDRAELSTASFANWVAKTANLLVDGLALTPGATVGIGLPRHWLAPVWALATWSAGLTVDVTPVGGAQPRIPIAVAVVPASPDMTGTTDTADTEAAAHAEDLVVVSLLPLVAPSPVTAIPPGAIDYARDISGYGDRFTLPAAGPDQGGLTGPGHGRTVADLVVESRTLADAWDLSDGGRLLVAAALDRESELLAGSIVPLVAGGSVVLVANAGARDRVERIAELERVTAEALPAR
jgi:uncharacterized protein (TIGR03089 family)